ncbi:MAG TPA: ACT domain-containing protein [Herpetosiphonaceae bacterium]
MNAPKLTLTLHNHTLAVCRLAHDAPLPDWALQSHFFSITRTPDELSIVCAQEVVPDGTTCERDWRCLKVAGPLDFALTGVLAALVLPLAQAGISIFAVSTFDTDYLLVKAAATERAIAVLVMAGHTVQG